MLRASTANHRKITGLNDFVWHPAISTPPTIGIRLFKGDFDGTAAPNGGSMSIQIDRFIRSHPDARRLIWQGAKVKLWAGEIGQAWPWDQVYEGLVDGDNFTADGNRVRLNIKSDTSPFEKDALTLKYAGTGGAEGGDSLKGQVKPWLLGRCSNVEPVLIDADFNVYQFSGYGQIEAVNVLYERGSPFGASTGNHASYAALVAASIPNGSWATCLAEGLIRLGAPQYGVITGDVDGDKYGGTWRRKTGEIVQRIASNTGVSASVDASSWNALDTALAGLSNQGRIGYFLNSQQSVMDCAAELAAPCNAQAGVSLLGKLFACRIVIGAGTLTLDAQQRQLPRVVSSEETGVSSPFSNMKFGYDRAWRVHTSDEIAFTDSATNLHQDPPGRTFTANSSGVLDGGQLPASFQWKRFRGDVDVSSTSTWTIDSQSGISGGTVTISNGIATIPSGCDIAVNAIIRAKSARDGQDVLSSVQISRSDASPAITGGGGGGTTVTDSSLGTVTTTTLVAISDEMTVTTGASGIITFAGNLAINAPEESPHGLFGAKARWKYKPVGGSYSNVGASDINHTTETHIARIYDGGELIGYGVADQGYINVADSQTGLSATTDYVVQLWGARNTDTTAKSVGFGGSVSAAGT
jgi:hypothetical protein